MAWSWDASDIRNVLLSVAALIMAVAYSRIKGYSPLECLSYRADDWFALVLRGEMKSSPRFRLIFYGALVTSALVILLPLLFYRY